MVNIAEGGTCAEYCASFGHACFSADEENAENNCKVESSHDCIYKVSGTSDFICGCMYPAAAAHCTLDGGECHYVSVTEDHFWGPLVS